MINQGVWRDVTWPDGWTSATIDGKRSAQFEHTIIVTDKGCEILTARLPDSPPLWWEKEEVSAQMNGLHVNQSTASWAIYKLASAFSLVMAHPCDSEPRCEDHVAGLKVINPRAVTILDVWEHWFYKAHSGLIRANRVDKESVLLLPNALSWTDVPKSSRSTRNKVNRQGLSFLDVNLLADAMQTQVSSQYNFDVKKSHHVCMLCFPSQNRTAKSLFCHLCRWFEP